MRSEHPSGSEAREGGKLGLGILFIRRENNLFIITRKVIWLRVDGRRLDGFTDMAMIF
jgi:hypothetical protein